MVILGVLAAVAVLAVTRFMGRGSLEAATTELHQAQTAIAACMADGGVARLDAAVPTPGWDGSAGVVQCTPVVGGTVYDAADSILGKQFKAGYIINIDGEIIGATLPATGAWSGIRWNAGLNGWEKIP